MAYLYRKLRSPFWYIQYIDADKNKHDKSTGFRADDSNDTIKAKVLRAGSEGISTSADGQRRSLGLLGPQIF
jgi:hypothetical protein